MQERKRDFGGRGQGSQTPAPYEKGPWPSPQSQITGAILAGGFSRRLGRDKATLLLGGKPLALWVAEALEPVVSACWLVTNQALAHLGLGLPLITDLQPFRGPLGGLITALFYARTPWVLAAAVDNPFPSPALLAALVSLLPSAARRAVVCRSPGGLEPFPGLYSVGLFTRLREFARLDRRPLRFLEVCRPLVLEEPEVRRLDPEGSSFFNLNTPEEVERAQDWLAQKGGCKAVNPSF